MPSLSLSISSISLTLPRVAFSIAISLEGLDIAGKRLPPTLIERSALGCVLSAAVLDWFVANAAVESGTCALVR